MRQVRLKQDIFPFKSAFTISRGTRTQTQVLTVHIYEDKYIGYGECVPYSRYGESVESVHAQLTQIIPKLEKGLDLDDLQSALPAGAARNAIDCALWDLKAKQQKKSVAELWHVNPLQPVETAYTISLDTPEIMARTAHEARHRPILKIKLSGVQNIERIRAVHSAAPHCKLIVDANEAWTLNTLIPNMLTCAESGVVLIEQPLAADNDQALGDIPHPVPICADESAHTRYDLPRLQALYDFINIKLDKTGGLSEAMALLHEARAIGFGIMVGSMMGSSLSMAPAFIPAQLADIIDLDAPLFLAQDRPNQLRYANSIIAPPKPELWG